MTAQDTLRTWNCLVFAEILFIPYWDAGALLILLLFSVVADPSLVSGELALFAWGVQPQMSGISCKLILVYTR